MGGEGMESYVLTEVEEAIMAKTFPAKEPQR